MRYFIVKQELYVLMLLLRVLYLPKNGVEEHSKPAWELRSNRPANPPHPSSLFR